MTYLKGEREELERYISQLQKIALVLRFMGLCMLIITSINIFIVAISAVKQVSQFWALQMTALFFVITVLVAMLFEQFRRRGEVIYGEVTDELHRTHDEKSLERPRISFRIALKNFAISMDLPLIPGRFGGSLYLLLNLAVLVFAFLVYRYY